MDRLRQWKLAWLKPDYPVIPNIWQIRYKAVLELDVNSEIGAHVRSNPCYLICLRHLIRTRAVANRIFSPERYIFLYAYATCSELPSYTSTMGRTGAGYPVKSYFLNILFFGKMLPLGMRAYGPVPRLSILENGQKM